MQSRDKSIELEPTVNEEKESDDEGTFSVITNLFLDSNDKDKKAKPPLSRIPFNHIGFYEAPALGNRSFNWEAKVLQSKRDLDELKKFFTPEQLSITFSDFQGNTILALMHTSFKANSAIRVARVLHDDRIHILSELAETGSNCSVFSSTEANHYLHMVSIPESVPINIKEIRVDLLGKYEACLPTLKWKQKTYSPVAYKTLHYESNSKKSWKFPAPRIVSFNNNWGEWDLLKKKYCLSCNQIQIPDDGGLIAIFDGMGLKKDFGKSHLLIDKIYRNSYQVGIGLKRVVELCEQSKPNYPMLLLQVDKGSVPIEGAFTKSNIFRLPSAFIPEDQVPCGSLGGR
ncbi:MAG: hypothetical protein HRU09_11960 [Oligoflexales bacterium]|nr:hypothetical protein [Oligoflexales bacterium]